MVQKVLPGEYLKGYMSMTDAERKAYRKRVWEWLRSDGERLLTMTDRPMARAQNLMLMSTRWSREDCRALHSGAVLLTALTGMTDTWLPSQLWVKSAWRAVRQIVSVLTEAFESTSPNIPYCKAEQKTKSGDSAENSPKTERKIAQTDTQTRAADRKGNEPVPAQKAAQAKANAAKTIHAGKPQGALTPVPVRPRHIDQYLHLLPKRTQERGLMVRGLLRELDEAREKARLLTSDGHASADSRAAWAKKTQKIDETLGKIYKELDVEWGKLVSDGRVFVDELGNAHAIEASARNEDVASSQDNEKDGVVTKSRGRKPLTEEEKAAKKAEKDEQKRSENIRKAGLLRKWLIDLRNAKTPEQQERWKKRYKEMVKLGGEESVTEKVKAAAEYYGVKIDGIKK